MSAHSSQKSVPKRLDSDSESIGLPEESQNNTIITQKTDKTALRDAIVDLYLDVKIRSSDEIDNYGTNQFQKERDKLNSLSLATIVEYIKASIEILMNMKLDESEPKDTTKYKPSSRPYFKKDDKPVFDDSSNITDYEPPKEYEKVIQKLEADVRNHIRVEQQLKLHIETVHNKMEELETK